MEEGNDLAKSCDPVEPVNQEGCYQSLNRRLAIWLLGFTLAALLLIVVAGLAEEWGSRWGRGLGTILVLLCGAGGAGLSTYRKANESNARMLSDSLLVRFVSGAISALILWVLIVADLLEGTLFPEVAPDNAVTEIASENTGMKGPGTMLTYGPASVPDYAKLVAWSIVAGFYEESVYRILGALKGRLSPDGDSPAR